MQPPGLTRRDGLPSLKVINTNPSDYWEAEPDSFLRCALRVFGHTGDEIDAIIRERIFKEREMLDRGIQFLRDLQKREERRERELERLGVLVKNELIRVMRKAGKTDEEIDAAMASIEAGGYNGSTIQPEGVEPDGPEIEFSEAEYSDR